MSSSRTREQDYKDGRIYFEGLLNADDPKETLDLFAYEVPEELDINMEPPNMEELDQAISRLKQNKAPVWITSVLKYLSMVVRLLKRMACSHMPGGKLRPLQRSGGKEIILQLPKKSDLYYCNSNRDITLLDISGKAFFTILLLRVKDEVDLKMRENQAGFKKGSSCQDQIFSLNQLIEKCIDQHLPCLINFIDFKATFDSIHDLPYDRFYASIESLQR